MDSGVIIYTVTFQSLYCNSLSDNMAMIFNKMTFVDDPKLAWSYKHKQ